jgi:hypothetical protein
MGGAGIKVNPQKKNKKGGNATTSFVFFRNLEMT